MTATPPATWRDWMRDPQADPSLRGRIGAADEI